MRYGPRDTRDDHARTRPPLAAPACPAAQPVRHVKSEFAEHHSGCPDKLRLDDPCKLLRLSMLAITQYKIGYMEWLFTE